MIKPLLCAVAGLLGAFGAGMATDSQDSPPAFETVLHSQQSGIHEPRDIVITDEAGWKSFWGQAQNWILPTPEPPAVDFSDQVVIVTAMGAKPSGGYGTTITRIEADTAGNYMVHVADHAPPPDMMTLTVVVYPVHAVVAPAPEGDVTFLHAESPGTPSDSARIE